MFEYPDNTTLLALFGTTLDPTLYPGSEIGESPWYVTWLKMMHRLGRLLTAPGALEPYKDDATELTLGVRAGYYMDGQTPRTYAGGTIALTDDATNYVYLTAAGVLSKSTSAWPSVSVPHVRIAIVLTGTASASAESGFRWADVTDYRAWAMFSVLGSAAALVKYPIDLRLHHGDFELVEGGWGTGGLHLAGQQVRNDTLVNELPFEGILPPGYVSGMDVRLVVHAKVDDSGGGTLGTCTLDAEVYELDDEGAAGSDINATAAIALTNAFGDKTFTITPTGLVAGDRLQGILRTSVQENADAGTLRPIIGSAELQCDETS